MDLKGGLMYAGVDGYPTRQQQPLNNVAPRGGFAYSMTDKTVIRGGYGLYWVPPITDIAEATIGARGYSAVDHVPREHRRRPDAGRARCRTRFPPASRQPQGNSLGLATGAGSVIDFVDQDSKPGYVQQYSVDWQRELPGEMAIAVGYMGSRSERLPTGRHRATRRSTSTSSIRSTRRSAPRCSRRCRTRSSATPRSAT